MTGPISFIPKSYEWRWYEDDAAEPTVPLANQEVAPTLDNNDDKIRLRFNITNTGLAPSSNIDIDVEWSTDQSSWNSMGLSDWSYADGQATQGKTVTSFLLSDTDTYGQYVESAGGAGTFDYLGGVEAVEWDFCIVPNSPDPSTTYYFRAKIDAVAVPLGGAQTHPSLVTATAPVTFTPKITVV